MQIVNKLLLFLFLVFISSPMIAQYSEAITDTTIGQTDITDQTVSTPPPPDYSKNTPMPESWTPIPVDTYCDIMITCGIYVYDASQGQSAPLEDATIWPVSSCDPDTWTTGPDGWANLIYAHSNFNLQIQVQADYYHQYETTINSSNCPMEIGLSPMQTQTQPCIRDGDVNLDSSITAEDAQLAFMIAMGMFIPPYEKWCAADCSGDGEVTAGDAQLVFLAALGQGTCFDPL